MFASPCVPNRSVCCWNLKVLWRLRKYHLKAPLPEQVVQEQVNHHHTITHKPSILIVQSTLPSLVCLYHPATRGTGAGASARHWSYSRVVMLFLTHSLTTSTALFPTILLPSYFSLSLVLRHSLVWVYNGSSNASSTVMANRCVYGFINLYDRLFFTSHHTKKYVQLDESHYTFFRKCIIKYIFLI